MNRSKSIQTLANHYLFKFSISNLDRTFNWIFKNCSKLLKFFLSLLDSSRPWGHFPLENGRISDTETPWIHERRKMLKCRWNGYVRVFDFTAATRGIFNQPHRSTEWEDLGQRSLSRQSISATISYSSFNFESVSGSFYRETEIPPTMFFHLSHVYPFFFFFFRKCYPLLNNQNIIILVKFHKLEFILFNNDKIWDWLEIYVFFHSNQF